MSNAVAINFTNNAAKKVHELIAEEGNPELKLRVFITGGGCSGFQYGFTFDEKVNLDDFIVEKKLNKKEHQGDEEEGDDGDDGEGGDGSGTITVKLLIDPMSFQYLVGSAIDYREDTSGAQFVISNPNAKTTCGCGSSFSA